MSVDAILSDDTARGAWQTHWREHLKAIGIRGQRTKPRIAVDFLTPHENDHRPARAQTVDRGDFVTADGSHGGNATDTGATPARSPSGDGSNQRILDAR